MPRMSVLNAEEKHAFDSPPVFNCEQRKQYFDVTPRIAAILDTLQSPTNKVCFLVATGYFKATKRFFGRTFRQRDIEYVARNLGFFSGLVEPEGYEDTTQRRHRQFIRDLLGFQKWNEESKNFVTNEIQDMVRSQTRPKFIFRHIVGILDHRHIEIPNSWALSEMILTEIKRHKGELNKTVNEHLSQTTRDFLDGLVETPQDDDDGRLQKSRLTLLKRISQSTKPTKIKGTVEDFRTIRDLYHDVDGILRLLDLTPEGIRYYAESVMRFKTFQVSRRADDDRHLHLVCFAVHQCFRLQDTLVDILPKAVQNTNGTCQREHKEIYYEGRKERRNSVWRFLNRVNDGAFTPLTQSESIAFDRELDDVNKVRTIKDVFASAKEDRETATENLDGLRQQLEPHAANAEYYQALESKSLKLQNRVSEIVKAGEFHGNDESLMEAITHYKEKDGVLNQSSPTDVLDEDERKALFNDEGNFRVSLYKTMLFLRIADAIKAGSLNLKLSYKYRSLDDYLIPKADWDENREGYLQRAELVQASDCQMTLDTLSATLHKQYELTNCNVVSGQNQHIRFHKDGRLHVTTPKVEDDDSESLESLFPSERYISLLEVLSTVNRLSNFVDAFEPRQTKYARAKPPIKTFFAGIMGIGCFIGTRTMEKISTAINGTELETTVNSYFSLENVEAANDLVLKSIDGLQLSEIYRSQPGILHTSSDGQKHQMSVDSLNATYSYKYFGKDQGVTAYNFIDERSLNW